MLTLICCWKRVLWMMSISFFSPLALIAAEASDDSHLAVCDLIAPQGPKQDDGQLIIVTNIPIDFECTICLNPDKIPSPNADILNLLFDIVDPAQVVKITRCQHYFHHRCLLRWLQSSGSCPLCRAVTSQGHE